jgi:hypothetical protein
MNQILKPTNQLNQLEYRISGIEDMIIRMNKELKEDI